MGGGVEGGEVHGLGSEQTDVTSGPGPSYCRGASLRKNEFLRLLTRLKELIEANYDHPSLNLLENIDTHESFQRTKKYQMGFRTITR